jgi:hypothetical protein
VENATREDESVMDAEVLDWSTLLIRVIGDPKGEHVIVGIDSDGAVTLLYAAVEGEVNA